MDCLFCKIVAGEIPNYTVYQDEDTLAFLDIHPCATGHTVVIPKRHVENMSDMSEAEQAVLARAIQAAAQKVYSAVQCAGMNIGINDRAAAGQAVPHAHWHLIPRFNNDGGGSMHSIIRNVQAIPAAETAQLFS